MTSCTLLYTYTTRQCNITQHCTASAHGALLQACLAPSLCPSLMASLMAPHSWPLSHGPLFVAFLSYPLPHGLSLMPPLPWSSSHCSSLMALFLWPLSSLMASLSWSFSHGPSWPRYRWQLAVQYEIMQVTGYVLQLLSSARYYTFFVK